MECDGVCRSKIDKLNISTHALTWSATGAMEDGELKTVDFNSRTHVECDMIFAFSCRTVDNFNSRTHVECDPKFIFYFYNVTISTHALTWSATIYVAIVKELAVFQLTHSRGVRRGFLEITESDSDFNSRTHVECDFLLLLPVPNPCHFNSRTHVECDRYLPTSFFMTIDFNSRTHVECDS